jgi:signal peptidase
MEVVDWVKHTYKQIVYMDKREAANSWLTLGLIVCSAVMIWKGLVVTTGSESPVVVVLSGSMEPAFQRGDILFLWRGRDPHFDVGEIVVFKVKGRDIPIVHRILEMHVPVAKGVRPEILTKGDNNPVDDRGLYNPGQLWLEPEDVLGRAKGFLPFVGMITIQLTDYPMLKYLLVGMMGLFVITSKDPNQ